MASVLLSTSLYLVCLAKGFCLLTISTDSLIFWILRRWILLLYLTLYCLCIEMLNLCFFLHKTDTIEKEIRKIFNIPGEKETRLWNKYMSNTFEPLNKPDSTIQDAGLYQGQVQWNIISFLEYIYLFAHGNVAAPNDFCFF